MLLDAASPSAGVLRLDFTAADASGLPARLEVGTEEVRAVVRVPSDLPGLLPDGVSARFLVLLAREDLRWSSEPSSSRLTVWIGDEDKAGGRTLVLEEDASYYAGAQATAARPEGPREELPARAELFDRSVAFVVTAAQDVRAAPSALAGEMGYARAGETKLADAQRGDWLHLVGGGWIRQSLGPAGGAAAGAPATAAAPRRTPAAWSVVMLGTGMQADVEEILPGEPDYEPLVRLFPEPVRLVALRIRVPGAAGFAFQLPPKKGRLSMKAADGRAIESLDPREMPLVDEAARPQVVRAFEAPEVGAGEEWATILLLPGDTDLLDVSDVRLDVGGMRQKLFRVPGSGEPIAEDATSP